MSFGSAPSMALLHARFLPDVSFMNVLLSTYMFTFISAIKNRWLTFMMPLVGPPHNDLHVCFV